MGLDHVFVGVCEIGTREGKRGDVEEFLGPNRVSVRMRSGSVCRVSLRMARVPGKGFGESIGDRVRRLIAQQLACLADRGA